MLTNSDKAWVAGLIAWLGQYAATRFGFGWLVTPEMLALVTGAATYWVPNLQRPTAPMSGPKSGPMSGSGA